MIPPRLAAFASRVGLTGLTIALLIAALVVQTVRLEGLSLWPLAIEGARPSAERLEGEIKALLDGQERAAAAQQAANDTAERIYRDVAERIDHEADTARAGALDGAERFIAANRVRCPSSGGAPSGTPAAAADRGAGSGEAGGLPAELDGSVAVPAADVRICTMNTLQAEAARIWALELEAASRSTN